MLNELFGSGREMRWCTDILHRVTDEVIERQRRRRDGDENNNIDSRRMPFIWLLLKLADEDALSMREVRDDVNTFMFAVSISFHLLETHFLPRATTQPQRRSTGLYGCWVFRLNGNNESKESLTRFSVPRPQLTTRTCRS